MEPGRQRSWSGWKRGHGPGLQRMESLSRGCRAICRWEADTCTQLPAPAGTGQRRRTLLLLPSTACSGAFGVRLSSVDSRCLQVGLVLRVPGFVGGDDEDYYDGPVRNGVHHRVPQHGTVVSNSRSRSARAGRQAAGARAHGAHPVARLVRPRCVMRLFVTGRGRR